MGNWNRKRIAGWVPAIVLSIWIPVAIDQGYFRYNAYILPLVGLCAALLYAGLILTSPCVSARIHAFHQKTPPLQYLMSVAVVGGSFLLFLGGGEWYAIRKSQEHVATLRKADAANLSPAQTPIPTPIPVSPEPKTIPSPKGYIARKKVPVVPSAPLPTNPRLNGVPLVIPPVNCDNNAGNCAGVNYGTQTIIGDVPPRARSVPTDKRESAAELLETAPVGSTVRFTVVGGGREISSIVSQIESLFGRVKDKWTQRPTDSLGQVDWSVISDTGVIPDHGEGIHCGSGAVNRAAFEIAKRAMEVIGLPCGRNFSPDSPGDDFDIAIGTRIIPK